MNKVEKDAGKYFLQWETHPKQGFKGLCMLLERQCLVDVAICCGSNTLHAHKCVLAANSPYFKEHFENGAVEQVIINGLDYAVMKSVIEFMYCGETVFAKEQMKYFIAVVKLFKLSALENILAEYHHIAVDEICIPPPQFVCRPPKYPTAFKPFNNATLPPKVNYSVSNPYSQHKFKRKCLGTEAEKACAREAQASRIALANLRKVMASTPQLHSFIVEESCLETTVQNFIPNGEENGSDVQLINDNSLPPVTSSTKSPIPLVMPANSQGLTADKIKHILGNEDVEIMFRTSEGNFVNVSDEVLLNLSKGGLQYQVVDENGQIGEIRELKSLDGENVNDKVDVLPNNSDDSTEAHSLKQENFESKMTDNTQEIDNLNSEAQFSTTTVNDYRKNTLDFLHTSFNENVYVNSFGIHNPEIFEPENLSISFSLMDDHAMEDHTLGKYSSCDSGSNKCQDNLDKDLDFNDDVELMEQLHKRNFDTKDARKRNGCEEITKENKSSLKFAPDMFFADISNSEYMEGKLKPVGETK